jgi:hypothetical protein
MVTNNQEGIKGKDVVTIVRVGEMIINPRTMLIIIYLRLMLVRERNRSER